MRSSRLMRRSCSCARSTVPTSWRRTIQAVIRPATVNIANDSERDSAASVALDAAAEMSPRRSAISSPAISSASTTPSAIAVGMLTSMPATATSSTEPPSAIECVPSPERQACSISASSASVSDNVADARFQPRRDSSQAPAPPANRQPPIKARDWPSTVSGP